MFHCRCCRSTELELIVDFGDMPLANALLTKQQLIEHEEVYPLHLVWCPECTLLQATGDIDDKQLFTQYFYSSSFSDTFLAHSRALAYRLVAERHLTEHNLVIDIGSNDGYLLQYYKEQNIPVLGIDPAANINKIAEAKGIPTRTAFFSKAEGEKLAQQGIHADIIHMNNAFPHVGNQRDVIDGIAALLKPNGIAVIECAYAIDTIDHTEFDQVYHEHRCYFSLTSLAHLCRYAGLDVVHAELIPVHGGSLRIFLSHAGTKPDATVETLLQQELTWGVRTITPYKKFAERTATLKEKLTATVQQLRRDGKRIAAYGASAKGTILLRYCGFDASSIEYIVDRSTIKQGHYAPGTHLPILPVEMLTKDKPDYVLMLTWNFAEEIIAQQSAYISQGGHFIIPIPDVHIV